MWSRETAGLFRTTCSSGLDALRMQYEEARAVAKLRLEKISVVVTCDCGGRVLVEDFEPECPYGDRRYSISVAMELKRLKLKIAPMIETSARNCAG